MTIEDLKLAEIIHDAWADGDWLDAAKKAKEALGVETDEEDWEPRPGEWAVINADGYPYYGNLHGRTVFITLMEAPVAEVPVAMVTSLDGPIFGGDEYATTVPLSILQPASPNVISVSADLDSAGVYTREQMAEVCGVLPQTISDWAKEGRLLRWKDGYNYLYPAWQVWKRVAGGVASPLPRGFLSGVYKAYRGDVRTLTAHIGRTM